MGASFGPAIRLTFILVVFVVISVLFGALDWRSALLAVPPACSPVSPSSTCTTAFTVTRENETSLSTLFRFGITPLFLFSGTFFPISQLPDYLKPIAYVTPLFHGVELVRKVVDSRSRRTVVTSLPTWVSAAYLVAMTVIGMVLATRWLDRRIRP